MRPSRVVKKDGSITTPEAVIEKIELRSGTLKALIRTTLVSIRRDMVPLFERHAHFYVTVNIPPAVLGSSHILPMVEALELTPYGDRIVCEVTERQALKHLGRAALEVNQTAARMLHGMVALAAALPLHTMA